VCVTRHRGLASCEKERHWEEEEGGSALLLWCYGTVSLLSLSFGSVRHDYAFPPARRPATVMHTATNCLPPPLCVSHVYIRVIPHIYFGSLHFLLSPLPSFLQSWRILQDYVDLQQVNLPSLHSHFAPLPPHQPRQTGVAAINITGGIALEGTTHAAPAHHLPQPPHSLSTNPDELLTWLHPPFPRSR